MKKLQKFLALGLAAVMIVSLAACGGTNDKETTTESTSATTTASTSATTTASTTEPVPVDPFDGVEITVATTFNLDADSWYWGGVVKNALDEWALEHNASWKVMSTKDVNVLSAAIASGKSPEVFYNYSAMPNFANLGLFEKIDDYAEELAEKYGQAFVDATEYQGSYYGVFLPWNDTTHLRYNATLFDQYGVKTPKEYWEEGNWTWETFYQACKDISKDTDGDGVPNIMGSYAHRLDSVFSNKQVKKDEKGRISSILDTERMHDLFEMAYQGIRVDKVIAEGNGSTTDIDGVKRDYMGIAFVASDIYSLFGGQGWYNLDANGHEWAPVPVPVWKKGDTEYGTEINSFMLAPMRGCNLEAAISAIDYILEAGCIIEMEYSGLADFEFTGLKGTTDASKAYIDTKKKAVADASAAAKKLDCFDQDYVDELFEYITSQEKVWYAETYSGVTIIASGKTYDQPAATKLAALHETLKTQCEKYNNTYIFAD